MTNRTTGTPTRLKIAFKGTIVNSPAARQRVTPHKAEPGKSNRWFPVLNNINAKCGTAIPTKATGPQKAVDEAAKSDAPNRTRFL
jgi:hypothetical protein